MTDIVIASAARTPVGSFNGAFTDTPAHDLGAVAIKAALQRAKVEPGEVDEIILGQVLTAGFAVKRCPPMLSKDDAAMDAHSRLKAGLINATAVSKDVRAITRDAAAITRQLEQRQGGQQPDKTSSSPAFRAPIMRMRREHAQWLDER